ncbi:MAG: alpha/beta hydrolase [Hyphomicrobiaceae bacterium]|nr:alpha/beta hydrolase [Hyphomicrobiaceae bacterium]
MIPETRFVKSADGTTIAYSIEGSGPAVILIEGAMCYRTSGALDAVAAQLKDRFTCITYDRRGRGESNDAATFAPDREIEDIAALVAAAGGHASLVGLSSGAAIALETANRLAGIDRVVTYEAPFVVDDTMSPLPEGFRASIERAVSQDRRGDALKIFMRRVGVPGFALFIMQFTAMWKRLKAIANTLSYDLQFVENHSAGKPLQPGTWPNATMPALAMAGGKSPAYMINSQKAIAANLANATYRELAGQTHMVKTEPLVAAIREFLE